jgi:FkbM family methyltransferase
MGNIGLYVGGAIRQFLPPPTAISLTARANWLLGEPELRVLTRLCSPSQLAVDVGANFGAYTYWLARRSQRCVAFEPNPTCASFLRRARMQNVTVEEVALSTHSSRATLAVPRKGRWEVTTEGELHLSLNRPDAHPHATLVPVETRRLDDYHLSNVGVMKIDTQGHEGDVLRGALETIRDSKPYLLVECEERHRRGALAQTFNILTKEGYLAACLSSSHLRRFDSPEEGYRIADSVNFLFLAHESPGASVVVDSLQTGSASG